MQEELFKVTDLHQTDSTDAEVKRLRRMLNQLCENPARTIIMVQIGIDKPWKEFPHVIISMDHEPVPQDIADAVYSGFGMIVQGMIESEKAN